MELQGPMRRRSTTTRVRHDALWQERYLGVPGMRIAGGTDEILKNIIAERVLRLPPEIAARQGPPFRDIPTGPPKS